MAEDEFEDIELNDEDVPLNEETPKAPIGPGLKKIIVLAAIVLVQAAAAYGVARFLILPRLADGSAAADTLGAVAEAEPEEPAKRRERGDILLIEDIVVNVQEVDRTRLLMVSVAIEYKDKGLAAEIEERMPQLRAMVIDHLTNRQVSEVVHREGRNRIKQDLLEEINETLRSGNLITLYFSNFVVQ